MSQMVEGSNPTPELSTKFWSHNSVYRLVWAEQSEIMLFRCDVKLIHQVPSCVDVILWNGRRLILTYWPIFIHQPKSLEEIIIKEWESVEYKLTLEFPILHQWSHFRYISKTARSCETCHVKWNILFSSMQSADRYSGEMNWNGNRLWAPKTGIHYVSMFCSYRLDESSWEPGSDVTNTWNFIPNVMTCPDKLK